MAFRFEMVFPRRAGAHLQTGREGNDDFEPGLMGDVYSKATSQAKAMRTVSISRTPLRSTPPSSLPPSPRSAPKRKLPD
jgi:hypothetical protein